MLDMLRLVLRRAFEEYLSNLKVVISYLLLLIFVFLFIFFQEFFVAAGTIFLNYHLSFATVIGLFIGIVFLYFFSFFVSLTIYSVKRDIQEMTFDNYWNELMKGAALKIFFLYLMLSIVFYIVSIIVRLAGLGAGFSVSINLVIAALLMYAPQSIVLDEAKIKDAVTESIGFFSRNLLIAAATIFLGSIILGLILLLEYGLELASLPGTFVSIILVLVLLVPLIEQMKSYTFILKVELLKGVEMHQSKIKSKKVKKLKSTRLHEKHPGGKL